MPDQDGTARMVNAALSCCETITNLSQRNVTEAETEDQKMVAETLHEMIRSQNSLIAALIEKYLQLGELYDDLVEEIKKIDKLGGDDVG